jgi:hypothetical protein
MARNFPYFQPDDEERFKAIRENRRSKLPGYYSQALRNLVDYLLTVDQDERPNIEQVLR